MRSVKRSPEPAFLADLRAKHSHGADLQGYSSGSLRDALRRDFGPICAYCQQSCQLVRRPPNQNENEVRPPPDEESIDHFRPKKKFPSLQFDWPNLIYACYRCNQNKADKWPEHEDEMHDQFLSREDARYTPISEYVSPNMADGQRPATEFFGFDVETGEMTPAEQLSPEEWSIARRTIWDIDLNDDGLGSYDRRNLCRKRLAQLDLLIKRLNGLADVDCQIRTMLDFMAPDKPFSGFISAYVAMAFPYFSNCFSSYPSSSQSSSSSESSSGSSSPVTNL